MFKIPIETIMSTQEFFDVLDKSGIKVTFTYIPFEGTVNGLTMKTSTEYIRFKESGFREGMELYEGKYGLSLLLPDPVNAFRSVHVHLYFMQQPATCASVLVYGINFNIITEKGIELSKALLHLVRMIAVERKYTFLKLSHKKSYPGMGLLTEFGFVVKDEYINDRTLNTLVDMVYKIC